MPELDRQRLGKEVCGDVHLFFWFFADYEIQGIRMVRAEWATALETPVPVRRVQ